MKRILSFFLILCLVMASVALADTQTMSFRAKTGQNSATVTKTTSTGSAGHVEVTKNEGGHSMYYQIRKSSGDTASIRRDSSGVASFSLSYLYDKNGMSLGCTGYDYILRVVHSSQCPCNASTPFNVGFNWYP